MNCFRQLGTCIFISFRVDDANDLDDVSFFDDGLVGIECATQIERSIGFCKDVVIDGVIVASDGSHGDDCKQIRQ